MPIAGLNFTDVGPFQRSFFRVRFRRSMYSLVPTTLASQLHCGYSESCWFTLLPCLQECTFPVFLHGNLVAQQKMAREFSKAIFLLIFRIWNNSILRN